MDNCLSVANKLLRCRKVVEGHVRKVKGRNASFPDYELVLANGLRGRLSANFLRCDDEADRKRRCQSIQQGVRLRVRVVRVRQGTNDPWVELVEEGADLQREILNACRAGGNLFQVDVIDEASNKDGCFGLFVRVMDRFRALLHVNDLEGRTHGERLRRLKELRALGCFPVELLSVSNVNDFLRIAVRPSPGSSSSPFVKQAAKRMVKRATKI